MEKQSLLHTMFFGNRSASYNACEAIAAYNGMVSLQREPSFPQVLTEFEEDGLCFRGAFGTAPKKVERFFASKGLRTKAVSGKKITEQAACELEKCFECFVVTVYNDKNNILAMVHTMCITRVEEGFCAHNTSVGAVSGQSLYGLVAGLNNGTAKPLWLMGVGERREIRLE